MLIHFKAMVAELASGVCMALEICGKDDTYKEFREFCGPMDPVSCTLILRVIDLTCFKFRKSPNFFDQIPLELNSERPK